MAENKKIFGENKWGVNEINDGGIADVLSVYKELFLNEGRSICISNTFGSENGLGQRQFLKINIPITGNYRITAQRNQRLSNYDGKSDPDIRIHQKGNEVDIFESTEANKEQAVSRFLAGVHVIEIYDYERLYTRSASQKTCFNVEVASL